MSAGTVSVVIAVYNGELFLADALRSILGQTVRPAEICVVDDGSDDGTSRVAQSFSGVRYLRREKNGGQASALNWGIENTSGEWLAFLDADDIWTADKLERQLEAFGDNPQLDIVYGLMVERMMGGARGARDGSARLAQLPSAMLVKRASFERVGGFDARFTLGSVVDWYARACELGLRQTILPRIVYERRIHGDNVGIRRADQRDDYLAVLKTALDRRRQRP
jgi:glycosyltransferase involved in cell wall biosynthesis